MYVYTYINVFFPPLSCPILSFPLFFSGTLLKIFLLPPFYSMRSWHQHLFLNLLCNTPVILYAESLKNKECDSFSKLYP
ncbi:unnamed protein product, partial [Gulo gulo]